MLKTSRNSNSKKTRPVVKKIQNKKKQTDIENRPASHSLSSFFLPLLSDFFQVVCTYIYIYMYVSSYKSTRLGDIRFRSSDRCYQQIVHVKGQLQAKKYHR